MLDWRSHSAARINSGVNCSGVRSERKAEGVDKEDRLLMAVALIAVVALTAGWVYGLGWAALKVIKLI